MRSRGTDVRAGFERDLIEAGLNEPAVAVSGYGDCVAAPIPDGDRGGAWRWLEGRWPQAFGASRSGASVQRRARRFLEGWAIRRLASRLHSMARDARRRHCRGAHAIGAGAVSDAHDPSHQEDGIGGDLGRGRVSMTRMGPPQQGQWLRSMPMKSRRRSR